MDFYVVRYHEIALKGGNRAWFEKKLMENLRSHLKPLGKTTVKKIHGRILIESEVAQIEEVLARIPGIANFSKAHRTSHDQEEIAKLAKALMADYMKDKRVEEVTFKVETARSDKNFPHHSNDFSRIMGGRVIEDHPGLKVKLNNPKVELGIEIWLDNQAVLYLDKLPGLGGLPVGTSGKVMAFLSGGIDSPVAASMMMRRGSKTVLLNFHSYPFIGEQSRQKVVDLAKFLSRFQPDTTLIIAPFTEIQKAIKAQCKEPLRTILYRRLMYHVAERLRKDYKIKAYVTGEAVGQVASQTLENIACTEDVASLPVIRPLIGMDKSQIIALAKELGTYETSIQPFPDCCTVFQPRKPETHGKLWELREEEAKLDLEGLLTDCLSRLEILRFDSGELAQAVQEDWD